VVKRNFYISSTLYVQEKKRVKEDKGSPIDFVVDKLESDMPDPTDSGD
jgi:hypothetical protein